LGVRIWYAQVEARKESTKVTAARIIRKKRGDIPIVKESGGKKETLAGTPN
jgi:hypothetical protein